MGERGPVRGVIFVKIDLNLHIKIFGVVNARICCYLAPQLWGVGHLCFFVSRVHAWSVVRSRSCRFDASAPPSHLKEKRPA